jgi:hypothetical protein
VPTAYQYQEKPSGTKIRGIGSLGKPKDRHLEWLRPMLELPSLMVWPTPVVIVLSAKSTVWRGPFPEGRCQ